MCGIAGVFGSGDVESLRAMLRTLAHRGPDDEHFVGDEHFAIGARRLSIVDVEGGRQPLSNEDRTVWACQNGELYNFPVLRKRLEDAGHHFATRADTELLPHSYEEYGTDAPRHIDGMFAVAIWDTKARQGIIARDRMGKKPLYYTRIGGRLYFASEIKALLAIPGFERRINLQALHHFLSLKHVPHPLTIFQDIFMLPPAHRLVYSASGDISIERYWDLDFSANRENIDETEAVDELLRLLRNGVKKRLMSDVPIGFFLSGGIDSSLSTVLATEVAGQRLKTFTLTYGDQSTTAGKDEDRKWARWIADRWETEHYEESIEFSDFPENLRRVIGCFDEPFAGTMSTFFLSALIAKHVKVAISGDGADELFGSYLSHRLAAPVSNFSRFLETGDPRLIRPFDADYVRQYANDPDWKWRSRLLVFSEEEKRALYSREALAQLQSTNTTELMREVFAGLTATDPLNRILEAEYRTIFPDQVLAFVDRLSMAHSLEVRSAYMDTDFVQFVASLPGRLKIKDGDTKYILKKAALRYFPDEMVNRKKEGFLMPVADWLRRDLKDYIAETLSPDRLALHGLFNPAAVRTLITRLDAPDSTYHDANKVLALLVFQEWFELYMNVERPAGVMA